MEVILCLLLGYLLGCLNPAALIGNLKKVDLRQVGTKNLGASNVLLCIGKMSGFLVIAVDIAKGYLSVKIARAHSGGEKPIRQYLKEDFFKIKQKV